MLLQPIADQLIAQVTDLRKVAGAANFAAAQEDMKATPSGYVIPLSDAAQRNTLVSVSVSQRVIERFGVILAVDNKRDVRGDAVNAALEPVRAATLTALLGFVPSADYDPVLYVGGKLLALDVTTLWWQLEFSTGYFERKV